ncbi:26248_t:CDS:2 [Gigaspora margarita]|uniref:26248_t:CDS:1 n=1 Tax=Gigaspora margarita TaxID=4874 RepID=A0ABM8VVD6_GIGMA|nr:26248_t:CDS:2 [Gigaspora margarita]
MVAKTKSILKEQATDRLINSIQAKKKQLEKIKKMEAFIEHILNSAYHYQRQRLVNITSQKIICRFLAFLNHTVIKLSNKKRKFNFCKQYQYLPTKKDQTFHIDYQKNTKSGDKITFDKVLSKDEEFGQPYLPNIKLAGEIIKHAMVTPDTHQLQQKSNELLQEEIRRAIREKLSRFTFPCPHCREDINDEHFGKEQRAFGYINEEMEQQRTYENFSAVKELKEIIKQKEAEIRHFQSPDYIENSIRVKKLNEEKKEIEESLQNQNQELQKELTEKKEQIQNLVLRQKGQVFDGQDRITDVSKGQTGMGKRADFLQEVLTETEPKKVVGRIIYETKNTEKWSNDWITKLENDMRTHGAEFGFIVATCESDKIIRSAITIDPRKKIYISGDNSNLFTVAKIMRELLITKYKFKETINSSVKEQKIRSLEDSLEDELLNQEKEANAIINKAEKIKIFKEKIRRLIVDKIVSEIKNI